MKKTVNDNERIKINEITNLANFLPDLIDLLVKILANIVKRIIGKKISPVNFVAIAKPKEMARNIRYLCWFSFIYLSKKKHVAKSQNVKIDSGVAKCAC